MKKNLIVHQEAKRYKVHLWQIAKMLGVADTTFSKKLRQELSQNEKDYIVGIIRQVAKEDKPDDTNILGTTSPEETSIWVMDTDCPQQMADCEKRCEND